MSDDTAISVGLRATAAMVDQLEQLGVRVSEANPTTFPETLEDGYITVSLTVGVPLDEPLVADSPAQEFLDSMPSASSESESAGSGGQWCGTCGGGPYENAESHHANRSDHEGEPILLEHEPDLDELVDPDVGIMENDTERPEGNQIYGETELEWCGYCGDGPFESVAHHHGHADHDGEPVVLDYNPPEDEIVDQSAAARGEQSDSSPDADADAEVDGAVETRTKDEDGTVADGGAGFGDFKNQSAVSNPLKYKKNIELRTEIAEALDLPYDPDRTDDDYTEYRKEDLKQIVLELTEWEIEDFEAYDEGSRQQFLEILARELDCKSLARSHSLNRSALKRIHNEAVDHRHGGESG